MHMTGFRPFLLCVASAVAALAVVMVSEASPALAQNLAEQTNRGVVQIVIPPDTTSVQFARDMANVLDDGATRRLVPLLGRGSFQNLVDLRLLRGVDLAILRMDVLDAAKRQPPYQGMAEPLTYVTRLYKEELHILAPTSIPDVAALQGKRVSFAPSAQPIGPAIFDILKVKVQASTDEPAVALAKLRNGQLDALVYVGGKPLTTFGGFRSRDGLHFLGVPFTKEMASLYLPAWLTAEDYPDLVAADSPVNTIAVDTVLFVAPLQARSDRYRNVASFVDAFFTQFPRLQEGGRHGKWQEVDLAVEQPGWRRFAPAEAWLQRNSVASSAPLSEEELRDVFSRFLDERTRLAGGRAMGETEKRQLFDLFLQWQKGQTR